MTKHLLWTSALLPAVAATFLLCAYTPAFGNDTMSVSGRIDIHDIDAQQDDSVRQKPDFEGRLKLEGTASNWRVHAWFEGGWDGSVHKPAEDSSLFKDFDRVYQSNSPYAETKELYVTHSADDLDLRAGIQRFAWGRLDEYPLNDLLNPWDYTRFLVKPLEDRKIGVPSLSATMSGNEWSYDAVWVPAFVPYRLPLSDERWSGSSLAAMISQSVPRAHIELVEPDLPERSIENSSVGFRVRHSGSLEWALNYFHGIDPRPVYKSTALTIQPQGGTVLIDPGYVPDFHRMDVIGMDASVVKGDFSMRAEAAFSHNRYLNIRRELWGYPLIAYPGITPLNMIEQKHDTLEYGVNADYRLFEDGTITLQAQQTVIFGDVGLLYERKVESMLWANLKIFRMNQKIETNINFALNPEHGDSMTKINAWYVFSDFWKAGVSVVSLDGPSESLFGRYSRNDQAEADLIYAW